eukprot:TRINITY_DN16531_c0_g1_i2.p1 TRINITY_DN16531_c0_g1~~TRINITY_DN16531_c0_g1_i2.p1  ORF type:complete len:1547 (+),score=254.13 TRINITY_DN16531_c0_g1_i2:615-4643(+)
MDEIVLSNGAMMMIAGSAEASTLPGHPFKVYKLSELSNRVDPASITTREPSEALIPEDPAEEETFKQNIFSFLCDTVLNTWGRPGELRTVSTIFLRILGDEETDLANVMHESLTTIQGELVQRDGVLNKVLYDDKGVTLLCVFGLPGHSHEDDAMRSLAFAWGICCKLEGAFSLAFGISRSKVYCGYCGSETRREYTVLGDGVNMAARVMQHAFVEASKRSICDGPVCTVFTDDNTKTLCNSMFRFEGGSEVTLKGKFSGCKVWEVIDGNTRIGKRRPPLLTPALTRSETAGAMSSGPPSARNSKRGRKRHEFSMDDLELDEYDSLSGGGSSDQRVAVQIFGREMQLSAALDAVWSIRGAGVMGMVTPDASHPSQRCVTIYGDAAMGKSVMLRKISEDASHRGVTVMFAQGLQLDRNVPYSCLQVLLSIFSRKSLSWLSVDIDATDRGLRPLLNNIVPNLGLDETPETLALTDSEKAEAIQDIATGLIKRAYDGAVLLCIDDAHWADTETLSVVTHVVRTLKNVGAVVTLRSEDTIQKGYTVSPPRAPPRSSSRNDQDQPEEWGGANAFDGKQVLSIYLGPLDVQATAALFRRVLGCPVDDQIVSVVHTKSGGNPGFAEQILVSLVDQENSPIVIADRARFATGVDVTKINLPDGIEGVITNRVDRLSAQHQHYLKVASVIGPTFSLELLSKVLKDVSIATLSEAFTHLEATGFVTLLKSDYEARSKTTGQPSRRTRQGRSSVISISSRAPKAVPQVGSTSPQQSLIGVVYTFKLHLIVDALYGMLLKRERREFHLLVAREIEDECKETNHHLDVHPLIHHYSSAGMYERALHFLSTAIESALSKGKVADSTRFALQALEIHDKVAQSNHVSGKDVGRLKWLASLSQSQYQSGDFEGAYSNAIQILRAEKEQLPVGCGMSVFTAIERAKIWLFSSRESPPTPTEAVTESSQTAEILLLAYHALAMVSYYNEDETLMTYFCLRGLDVSRGLDCSRPHLKGKRGVLLMLQKLPGMASPTYDGIMLTMKKVKDMLPGDKAAIIRVSGLQMINIGAVKEAEQCWKHRLKGDVEPPFLQMMHMTAGVCKGMVGKVGEANRRLLNCAKLAHSVQDRRVEAYAMLLSVYIDCCLSGEQSRLQQAGEKISRVDAMVLPSGCGLGVDRKLAALRSAITSVVSLRDGDISLALKFGFESSLRHIEIRKCVASVITTVSIACTLEVLLSVPVLRLVKEEKSEKDHRKHVTFLLGLLRSFYTTITWARPIYYLFRGQHETYDNNNSLAITYLQRCHNESQVLGTHIFSAHAMIITATQLSPAEGRCEAYKRARILYNRAGVSEHLQSLYDVPIG